MQKIKKVSGEFGGYLKKMNPFSYYVLAAMCELSCVFLILSLFLHQFASAFQNIIFVQSVSESCAQTGLGFLIAGIIISLLSDIVAKHDFHESE